VEDPDVDGRIILKLVFNRKDGTVDWIELCRNGNKSGLF